MTGGAQPRGGPALPRPAATVVLARPSGPHGAACEVYLQQRADFLRFLPGFHVFPGGALDAADGSPEALALLEGRDACARGDPAVTPAHLVAVLRECYEEAGVLIARDRDGRSAHADPARASRLAAARAALEVRGRAVEALLEVLRREGLRLAGDAMRYLAHWVTPSVEPVRFDTRFFLARLPEGAEPAPCSGEAVGGAWWAPGAALAAWDAGRLRLVSPTRHVLGYLAQFDSIEEVWRGCDDGTLKLEGIPV